MNCMLIDCGSTFIKYCVYEDSTKQLSCSAKIPFPSPMIDDGKRFIVSEKMIRQAFMDVIAEGPKYNCGKYYLSVQMHGFLLRGPKGAVGDYVSWRDHSGRIDEAALQALPYERLGTSLKDNLPLTKIDLNAEGEFFTLGSYLAWILTGNNATHITDACASGLFFADSGECAFETPLKMPEISQSIKPVGEYCGALVYTPVGDHQISVLGSGVAEKKYLVNIGTATQISCVASENFASANCEKRPWFYPSKRLYTVSGLVGGAALYDSKDNPDEHERRLDMLLSQITAAINTLPSKDEVLLGGGGALMIYDRLAELLIGSGISCTCTERNIGEEGLRILAENHRTKAGVMLSEITFPNFPIIAHNSGLDFIIIDSEHGAYDYASISALIMNANLIGLHAIVRIGDASRSNITKLADMGVHGFLLPMTNTRKDIQAVVDYAKYIPVGHRGVSTTRAHTAYSPPPLKDYMRSANENMFVFAQIETKQGLENIMDIMSVPGVNGVFMGPNDLSVDLGCIGDKEPVIACMPRIAEASTKTNKPWGIITGDSKLIKHAQLNGATMVSCGSELNMLISGCKKVRSMF